MFELISETEYRETMENTVEPAACGHSRRAFHAA